MKKIKINSLTWKHHRYGWEKVITTMKQNFHTEKGVLCEGWVDGTISRGDVIETPWVGFLHNSIKHPNHSGVKYEKMKSLEQIIQTNNWKVSEMHCKGIFVLCETTKKFLINKIKPEVNSLFHPIGGKYSEWKPENYSHCVVQVGHWLRNYAAIHLLDKRIKRSILKCNHTSQENDLKTMNNSKCDPSVQILNHANDAEYDNLLSKKIVFLNLYDVAANNTILDCIIRNTPLIINRLPAAEEYLGRDYPLFYDSLDEASKTILNKQMILEGYEYLKSIDKSKFSEERFISDFCSSPIYRNLPLKLFI